MRRWMKLETDIHIGALDWVPKVQMRSRRREVMSKEVRIARGAPTHWDSGTDLMWAHQGQLNWDWWNMLSTQTLWMWLMVKADWEAKDSGTGFRSYCMYWLCGSLVCLDAHFPRPGWSGEDLGLPTGQGTLTALWTGEGGVVELEDGGEKWKEGRRWKFLSKNKNKKRKREREKRKKVGLCIYMFLVSFLGLFSYCLLILSCFSVLYFAQSNYYIIWYYNPLEASLLVGRW